MVLNGYVSSYFSFCLAVSGGRGEPSQTDMQSDSALPLTQVPVQHPVAPAVVGVEYPLVGRRTMEAPMEFWDGLMEGDPVMVEGMAPDHAGGGMRGDGAGNEADDDASSTASCVNLVLPAVAPEKEPVAPHAKGNNDTTKVHDTGNELIDAFEKFLGNTIICFVFVLDLMLIFILI